MRAEGAQRSENPGRANQEGAGWEISCRGNCIKGREESPAGIQSSQASEKQCGGARQVTEQQLGPEGKGGRLRKKHCFSRESEEVGGLDMVSAGCLEDTPQSHPGLSVPVVQRRDRG